MEDLPHDEQAGHSGFQHELPDNAVKYLIFLSDPKLDIRATISHLETVRKAALGLSQDLTRDYIWQRDDFNLELKNEDGLIYLHGLTEYGDSVEDEWLVVYILREFTRSHHDVWIRVLDTDGEFLLVEAANVLPKWLSPEIDNNRVWINQGKLFIIPIEDATKQESRNLSLPDALKFIRTRQVELVYSGLVEGEAFYRLEKYPEQITNAIHNSLVTVPRRLAYILHELPKSVAPAVEAFYLRDGIQLKPIISPSAPLIFPPQDLVTISIRFSKVLFAQLWSQRFEAPPRWEKAISKFRSEAPTSSDGDVLMQRVEAGMKLTSGFEILAQDARNRKSRVARELAILIDDMVDDGDEALPSDAEIAVWPEVERNDSDSWLDIDYGDFERELDGRRPAGKQGDQKTFGDKQTQDNLKKIVSRFEAFLNDDHAGLDGAELEEMDFDDDFSSSDLEEDSDAEDREVSFDEEEFAKMMREMMGLPSTTTPKQPTTDITGKEKEEHTKKMSDATDDDEDAEIQKLSSQMEAELKGHGALHLDPPAKKGSKLKDASGSGVSPAEENQEPDNSDNSDQEVDVDYNLAKNILESFKSQGGMSGPTGNILGMMGINLPRDEDDDDENDNPGARPAETIQQP